MMDLESQSQTVGGSTRSAIQFSLLPLYAGILIGLGIDYVIWPRSTSLLDCCIFLVIIGGSCLYFAVAMTLISAVSDIMFRTSPVGNAWRLGPRQSWTVFSFGVLYAIVPTTLAAVATCCWSKIPSDAPTITMTAEFFIPSGLVLPFFLVRQHQDGSRPRKRHVARLAGAIVLCVVAALAVSKWGARSASHLRLPDCTAVVAWVRSTHTAPGDYKDLTLPSSLEYLSNDGRVEAVLLSDGRVILLFQSETPWISFCRYTLFSSSPLTGYEVGVSHPDPWFTSHWGYPELRVAGLPNFCIFSTLSPSDYVVGMNN
jgi:hypothetical protein